MSDNDDIQSINVSNVDTLELISKEGESFTVLRDVAKQCDKINIGIEDMDDNDEQMFTTNISSKALKHIIDLLNYVHDKKPKLIMTDARYDKPFKDHVGEFRNNWVDFKDDKVLDSNGNEVMDDKGEPLLVKYSGSEFLCELFLATQNLGFKHGLHLCICKISYMLNDISSCKDITDIFKINGEIEEPTVEDIPILRAMFPWADPKVQEAREEQEREEKAKAKKLAESTAESNTNNSDKMDVVEKDIVSDSDEEA